MSQPSFFDKWFDTEACCGGTTNNVKQIENNTDEEVAANKEAADVIRRSSRNLLQLGLGLSKESESNPETEYSDEPETNEDKDNKNKRRRKMGLALFAVCACVGAMFGIGILVGKQVQNDNVAKEIDPTVSSVTEDEAPVAPVAESVVLLPLFSCSSFWLR